MGVKNLKVKNIIDIYACAAYTQGIHMLGAPTSTSYVHFVRVENVFKVQNSLREFCLYGRTSDVTSGHCSNEVCYVQCTQIMTAQFVCGITSFLLQTVGCMVRRGRGSANRCLTRRSVLYMKAGGSSFVVPY